MKKLLLIMTDFMKMNLLIEEELSKKYEIEKIYYSFEKQPFVYKRISDRIYNFYRKIIFNDRNYKKGLVIKYRNEELLSKVNNLSTKFDIAFVLNVEYFEEVLLSKVRLKSKEMIAYQWDGLNRTPSIYKKIKYFDRFYAFNPSDIDNKNILFASNFYFNINYPYELQENKAFYIGTYVEERIEKLNELGIILKNYDVDVDFKVYTVCDKNKNKIEKKYLEVMVIDKPLDYIDVLRETVKSKFIIDLKLEVHNGLSFRFFEAIKYKKKIITNNLDVINYDFYNPKNVFIIGVNPINELSFFLNSDYHNLSEEIVNKYSFNNWSENLLS